MDYPQMKSIIEGLLFVSGDEGIEAKSIAFVLDQDTETVELLLQELQSDFKRDQRGVQIIEIAGAYQMMTLPSHAPYFEKLAYTPSRSNLSQAALETLAIVAYKQPITRVGIEEIRGVKAERALHTLVSKDLIEEVGRAEAIGRPILYGTTKAFLDYFALRSLEDLPSTDRFEANLEEETRMLFDRLEDGRLEDGRQLTFDDVE